MRVAIVGCGLIGQKRAQAIAGHNLVAVADREVARAEALAERFPNCSVSADWHQLVTRDDLDVVIVATTHNVLAEITLAAVQENKHVLVEKPAARCARELGPVITAARERGVQVRVGFNHRYHPALRRAHALHAAGALGPLLYVRGRYGHGGRLGYEREWRADPALSGGGEVIDQGIHLIDLARWFLGDFTDVQGSIHTYFWKMPVEDNGFLLLHTAQRQVAQLHASCTEWKNLFSLEVFGRDGKLEINGLGGSYGIERLTHYRMLPEMGPPETTTWEYPMADRSWKVEFDEFAEDIRQQREPSASLHDAHAALTIVEQLYLGARQ